MGEQVPRTFYVKNFGCRAAQADGAGIAAALAARGLSRTEDSGAADMVVVNTCTVTSEADRDARKAIRRVHRENAQAEILVTGCYAQRKPADLAGLDGVKWVVGNSDKHRVADLLAPELVQITGGPSEVPYHGGVTDPGTLVSEISQQRELIPLPVGDPLGRSRPNVKVQDGCGNRCSFCIIPSVRGRSRSASCGAVVREVRQLQSVYPEVVLTGINLGRWGRDLDGRPKFADLLRALLAQTDMGRIRISSVEPMDWTSELLHLVASSPRIAEHMHVPLQSGSDAVLKRMRRKYRVRHYETRIRLARELMPDAAIGADVMVGFPGESEAEFEETRAFVERMPFTYLHVFSYSCREGTEAAALPGHVTKAVKKRRNRVLRLFAAEKNLRFRRRLVGRRTSAVTLSSGTGGTRSLSDNYIQIEIPGEQLEPRREIAVRIDHAEASRTLGSRLA